MKRERLLEQFMPRADVRERHATLVHAPAAVVFDVADHIDILSVPAVRAIFRLRAWALRATPPPAAFPRGFVAEAMDMGWGVLALRAGRERVMGAVAQPWVANVTFTPVAPERFADFAEPDRVKILWTLEAEPLAPARTRLISETRARATDEGARKKFLRYWGVARIGIVMIRWFLLPAIRRQAEQRWRAAQAGHTLPTPDQSGLGFRP